MTSSVSSIAETLSALLRERILFIDGAMGTMIQRYGLSEEDFRGERFADHPVDLKGNNDLLSLTRPEIIEAIHTEYLEAGADIIETNTFSAQRLSMADYGMEALSYELNVASAQCAKRAVARFEREHPDRRAFVAGAIGPTNRALSLSPDVNQPAFRAVSYDQVRQIYREQIEGLLDGGVDLLLIETIFDTLNAKAAIYAAEEVFKARSERVPVMISVTITDNSGRTLSGQTVEAFWASVAHAKPLSVGINCALGPEEMRPFIEALSQVAPTFVSCYPNAGLPNAFGEYDMSPEQMGQIVAEYAQAGYVNLVGGCCGTTPAHILQIVSQSKGFKPRQLPVIPKRSRYSGLEVLELRQESNFTMVGERTNVTGSRRFARLVLKGEYEQAVRVARDQVEGGANIIDINMDEGMLDGPEAMTTFLNLIATEPDVARVPLMIDSSRFEVIEAGLKCVQGKAIVNSISLKEGEEAFKRQAEIVRRHGAAVVVMAFDEQGQATDTERKVAICERAHAILTGELGFAPEDIIFDANILTVATGMKEHDAYAVNYIEAVRQIKARLPGVKTIGGVSNISFSFRGNEVVREAIHASFLYHAIQAGLDMGIVNAGQLAIYEEVEPELLEAVEDVLFCRHEEATERLVELAERYQSEAAPQRQKKQDAWRELPVVERLAQALVRGVMDHMEQDVFEALPQFDRPLQLIEGPLMDGMRIVGDRFERGKMFLPQVVKSARAMKRAVALLLPLMEQDGEQAKTQGTILLATVKGDVHDIGKNIVGVVLSCNNYRVVDLGVMVPANVILEKAKEIEADLIGLSGLITPSLDEMVHVAKEMKRLNMSQPLLIGGATTSRKHTSIKIAPHYEHGAIHVLDASRVVNVASSLLGGPHKKTTYLKEIEALQQRDRELYRVRQGRGLLSFEGARANRLQLAFDDLPQVQRYGAQTVEMPLKELVEYIDWTPFFITWGYRDIYPRVLEHEDYGESASELFEHAQAMLKALVDSGEHMAQGVYGFFPANSEGERIVLWEDSSRSAPRLHLEMLRQQQQRAGEEQSNLCLSDYIAPREHERADVIGAFAVTSGESLDKLAERYEHAEHDIYNALMVKSLADRLAEAFAERLHERAREELGQQEALSKAELIEERYRGIRPAPGYPACPDHTEKRAIWELLQVEERAGITLTESCAMWPGAAVSGWYFAHPEARYFSVGLIGQDQVIDYAERKGMSLEEAERWLAPNLGYDS